MASSWHGGKGSSPRPLSVSKKEFDDRWAAIFGKRDNEHVEVEKKELVDAEERQIPNVEDVA